MEKRTYTPGPWKYDTNLQIVHVKDKFTGNRDESFIVEVAEHNGHLIAASPDMLEALEMALAYIEKTDHVNKTLMIACIKQAIAKAKGLMV